MKKRFGFSQKVGGILIGCAVAFYALAGVGGLWATPLPVQDAVPAPPSDTGEPPPAQLTPDQLQRLVAPIALYPDALVAQILAASAYPTQLVEADRFLQQNPNLTGADLGSAVDQQDWDPSVKAMTQFPSVLADMDNNLSWTSELGDANYNQPADVMAAIQFMREKAEAAGNLQTTPQQTVDTQGDEIDIQPANPDVVYVPDYDPELVYGYPIGLWPGFSPWWGVTGPYLSFGVGFGIGPFFGYGWGWHAWGVDWRNRGLRYGGGRYAYQSHAFYDRNAYSHGNYRGSPSLGGGDRNLRGFGGGGDRNDHPGAFSGIKHGGDARGFSSRGAASMGGGFHGGGGGGFHGGGGRR